MQDQLSGSGSCEALSLYPSHDVEISVLFLWDSSYLEAIDEGGFAHPAASRKSM